jgi:signal transduction histidine kinase
MPSRKHPVPDFLPKLVKAALGKNARDCVGDMLEVVIDSLDSSGAVLWQATENAKPKAVPPQGCLFMLATAFPGLGSFGIHNLDFENTIAGKAVRTASPKIINDIRNEGGKHKDHPFLTRHGLNKTIALPFRYKSGVVGAVTVYRKADSPDYNKTDVALLKRIFEQVPILLGSAQTRARQELLEKAGEIFKGLEQRPSAQASSTNWNRAMKHLCDEIAGLFHTAETSVILKEGEDCNYQALASKAGAAHRKRIRKDGWRENPATRSFTEACLTLRRPIRIFDLRQPETEVAHLHTNGLPEFEWESHNTLETHAREALGSAYTCQPNPDLPPLSFLAVPITAGLRLHGVIRCWIANPPISYFSFEDQQLLELVADQLGRQCELRRREESFALEVTAWRKISDVLHSKREYRSPLSRPMGRTESIDEFSVGCLNLVEEVVKAADLNALWLLEPTSGTLQCVSAPWIHDSPGTTKNAIDQWTNYVSQRPSLDSDSQIATVLREQREQRLGSLGLANLPSTLPGARQQLLIPLSTRDKKLGVLEVGSSSLTSFTEHALHAARLIGAFLSHHLATRTALSGQQAAEKALLETERMTNDAFRDIMHQMKGPLVEAARRIGRIGEVFAKGSPQYAAAVKAEALVRRSFRTARRVGIFGQLVRGASLSAGREVVESARILEVLEDAWESARLRAHPRMRLRFNADFEKISASIPISSVMDLELLMHAVHNVLDNAIKYSYRDTEVKLDGGSTADGGWYLRVWNKGIPLRSNEVRLARQRGWRSAAAVLTTGEGSGIGLWLVDKITQALGGTFELNPTRGDGYTMARLQFNVVPSFTNKI